MDGDKNTTTDGINNNNNIVLIKKKGKVKALDEELYSRSYGYISLIPYITLLSSSVRYMIPMPVPLFLVTPFLPQDPSSALLSLFYLSSSFPFCSVLTKYLFNERGYSVGLWYGCKGYGKTLSTAELPDYCSQSSVSFTLSLYPLLTDVKSYHVTVQSLIEYLCLYC